MRGYNRPFISRFLTRGGFFSTAEPRGADGVGETEGLFSPGQRKYPMQERPGAFELSTFRGHLAQVCLGSRSAQAVMGQLAHAGVADWHGVCLVRAKTL